MSITKLIFSVAALLMLISMISSVDASAQIRVEKLGRPWEVDSIAMPSGGLGAPIGNGQVVTDDSKRRSTAIQSASGMLARTTVIYHGEEIRTSLPVQQKSVLRKMFSIFLFLRL